MNWIILIIAGLFEVAFASCLGKAKEATGNAVYWWYAAFVITLTASMLLLMKAVQTLPIGTAYAVWTGIGAVGTAILGIIILKEPASVARLVCIGLVVAGVIGLKVFGSSPAGN